MLKNRCALITGSVSGLGYAIADSLAQAGASIVLHGIQPAEVAEQARADLAAKRGVNVMVSRADLRDPAQIEQMMQQANRFAGGVDILVNNAVVRNPGSVDELSIADWEEALAVNLSSYFLTARLVLPAMRKAGWGRIINVSSVYGLTATTGRIAYITTKTALIGLTRAIAMDTADAGITCNALCPGTLPTPPILEKIEGIAVGKGISIAEAQREYIATRHPTGRFVAMENVGAFAAFLCTEAARDITGSVLPIDAGWTIE
ncbi:MAG: SDR family oxidoreductase [Burkholderiaceae bacterium]|nr:SDR family oxidoreductase [Burkholderiaceae bacterium]